MPEHDVVDGAMMMKIEGGFFVRSTFSLLILILLLLGSFMLSSFNLKRSQADAAGGGRTKFQRISTQFIAALGDPRATSGTGAQSWGLWPLDPGPRGVELKNYQQLKDAGGIAPARWKFDVADWWLEEHGLMMEQPTFPLPPGKYMVTGARDVTAVLTIHPSDRDGNRRWELEKGATLYDVTHLACRSARYIPAAVGGSCSPTNVQKSAFPVAPGGAMPPVEGCTKQDYAVLIVVAVGVED
jgi:hypothetical protein